MPAGLNPPSASPISETPPTPTASPAIQEAIEFLASVNDPRELIGKPRPAFMDELGTLAATRRAAAGERPRKSAAPKRPKPRRTVKPRARSSSASKRELVSEAPSGDRHQRRCTVCSHPDRADIEADFNEWACPGDIAREYGVSRIAIYRHARAAGLFTRRERNLRFALGRFIEHVDQVWPTPDSVVRAIHAFARINDEGQWVEPPAHVIVSSGGVRREAAAPPSRRPIAIQLDSSAIAGVIDVPAEPRLPDSRDADSGAQRMPSDRVLIDTPRRLECDVNR
ncbi:MAG: hypothetical protein KGL75_05460 [Acidobacteriota bacterium]|nr:hypothetical protein [Acidobacteriota bacterium]